MQRWRRRGMAVRPAMARPRFQHGASVISGNQQHSAASACTTQAPPFRQKAARAPPGVTSWSRQARDLCVPRAQQTLTCGHVSPFKLPKARVANPITPSKRQRELASRRKKKKRPSARPTRGRPMTPSPQLSRR